MNAFLNAALIGRRDAIQDQLRVQQAETRKRAMMADDIKILERLNATGRPVTPAGTILEERKLPQVPGVILPPSMQVERPVNNAALAEHTLADGRKVAFELFSPEEQQARAIERFKEQERARGQMRQEFDAANAIPTPEFLAPVFDQGVIRPSQFNMVNAIANQYRGVKAAEAMQATAGDKARAAEILAGQKRAQAEEATKARMDLEKERTSRAVSVARIRSAGRGGRAGAGGEKPPKPVDNTKEVTRLATAARTAQRKAQDIHNTLTRIAKGWKQGYFMDKSGQPRVINGKPVKSDPANALVMHAYVEQLTEEVKRAELERNNLMEQIRQMQQEQE